MPQPRTRRRPRASGTAMRASGIATRTGLVTSGRRATGTKTLKVATKPNAYRHLAVNRTVLVPARSHGAGSARFAQAILPGKTSRATARAESRLAASPGATDVLVRDPEHPGRGATANE